MQILRRHEGLGLLGRKVLFSFYMNKGIPRRGLCEQLFSSSKASLGLAQTQPDSTLFHFPPKLLYPWAMSLGFEVEKVSILKRGELMFCVLEPVILVPEQP